MQVELIAQKLKDFKKIVNFFRKDSLQSAKDIHTLRIKSRELFSLLNKNDEFTKSVKKVISLSNEIRDIDVFFSDYLMALPEKQRKKAQEKISLKAKDEMREKEIKKICKYLKNLKIPKSAEQKTAKEKTTQNLLYKKLPNLNKKKLHKYRIQIKKKLYAERNSSTKDENKIKDLTNIKDILGAINDNYNGLERLKSYAIKESLYEKIKKFTQKENKKLYKRLISNPANH